MRHTKLQTLTSIAAVIRKYKKNYCTASQEKLVELLVKYHGVSIQRRMLNYHLADLRKLGLIKTVRRTHRNKDGTLCLETSATCLTPSGYLELLKLGCEWAKKKYNQLMDKYFPKKIDTKKAPEPLNEEELLRRRRLGEEVMKSTDFRKAFNMDEDFKRRVPNF
jgi:hypothetical protein